MISLFYVYYNLEMLHHTSVEIRYLNSSPPFFGSQAQAGGLSALFSMSKSLTGLVKNRGPPTQAGASTPSSDFECAEELASSALCSNF